MLPEGSHPCSHCFGFERDFVGNWRCIPLCLRRKLDLCGVKLRLNHWLALTESQRDQLVLWPDGPDDLAALAAELRQSTAAMADGGVTSLPIPREAAWQHPGAPPAEVSSSAAELGYWLGPDQWNGLSELERFALCKLARPGHDHHNLPAALVELFAPTGATS